MSASEAPARSKPGLVQRSLPWLITVACFTYLYIRIDGAAARAGSSAIPFLAQVFSEVSWTQ
jgi:hypothetical protein